MTAQSSADARLARLRSRMDDCGLAALLVTRPVDLRWLTGFTGSAGKALVPRRGRPVLVIDGRYTERAAEEAVAWRVVTERGWDWLARHHRAAEELAVQADDLSWATVRELRRRSPTLSLRATTGIVEGLRQIKDPAEIAALRQACAITDRAFHAALEWLGTGLAENEVARRLVADMIELGAEGPAFDPIVASGPNGSRPHHATGRRRIQTGDLVTMDFGALIDGYHADMTRTVAVGHPDPDLRGVYDLVRRAQQAGVEAVADGVAVAEIDAACRVMIADAGHAEHFLHPTGHGVGLAIHEDPILRASTTGTLADRMTVTVEPGVYLPGLGGVRIEDVVLVGPAGAERLTTAPRELLQL